MNLKISNDMQTSDILKPKDIKNLLKERGFSREDLQKFLRYDTSVSIVEFIIKSNISIIDEKYGDGTPLMWATSRGNYETCKVLLKYGADKNIRNDSHQTALDYAHLPEIQKLLSHFEPNELLDG